MFTQHPGDSEFFDYNTFLEENIETLRYLFDVSTKAFDATGKSNDILNEDEYCYSIACLMSICVFLNTLEITFPLKYHSKDEDAICELAEEMSLLVHLFILEDKGLIVRDECKFALTKKGTIESQKLMLGLEQNNEEDE